MKPITDEIVVLGVARVEIFPTIIGWKNRREPLRFNRSHNKINTVMIAQSNRAALCSLFREMAAFFSFLSSRFLVKLTYSFKKF